jgi:RHH-type proline utilization regulon transcriptional repressor/proline dehydrogenase/delta 1-pyrroline-5-carboxylate dehydrogenase
VLDDLHQQRLVSTQWLATMTDVLDQAVTLMGEATVMPGPTGESNRLLLESRGVTLNLLTESAGLQNGQQQGLQHELQQWLGGMIAALAAGNPVLMLVPQPLQAVVADCQQIVTNMKLSGTPYRMAVLAHPEELGVVVDAPDTAALILSAASSWRTALARILAARRGAILPMICEPPGRAQLMRLVSEKTVTINTTAAGGNPALMMDDTD